jgi:hypothetical protein
MSIGADSAGQLRHIIRKARAHGIATPISDGPG